MEKPLSDKLGETDFELVRRGYDPIAVTSFLNKLSEQARQLEAEVANANARANGLDRRLDERDSNKHQVSAAFVAAADAKQALLEDAERQANRIIDRARDQASRLSGPHEDVEQSRLQVAELMLQAKRRVATAETESAEIIEAARRKAEDITTRTRTEALAAIEGSKQEAEHLLADAENEYRRVSLMLRGLKSAVREMIDSGEESHEEIAVVLADSGTPANDPAHLG
jgi:cell division septum initiation protein DivIVA